jgi:predicted alpha/beta-hydrolase family hydrolase
VTQTFIDDDAQPAVRGFLHRPVQANGNAIVLTHSAGGNCQSKLLTAMANALAEAGLIVLRCDLPFRQQRPHGPPLPGSAGNDRAGLRRAVQAMKRLGSNHVFLGGHSYGGRQATMLAAGVNHDHDEDQMIAGLLLLSYPLHPPRKPTQLRTSHFPQLATPALFVHGSRDPFGSLDEMKSALSLIRAKTKLLEVSGAGHELLSAKAGQDLPGQVTEAFLNFFP